MARKSWAELSPAYQKRLSAKGIGPREHAAGASIKAARGHSVTPERNIWRRKALALDIKTVIPGFDKLPTQEAEKVGRDWVKGFMTRAAGKPEPVRISDWRYGKKGYEKGTLVKYQTDEQKNAHLEFLSWTDAPKNKRYLVDEDAHTDWQAYRDAYQQKFSKG